MTFSATDPAGNTATDTTSVTVAETPGGMHGHGHIDMGSERHHFEFQVLDDRTTGAAPAGAERGHRRPCGSGHSRLERPPFSPSARHSLLWSLLGKSRAGKMP